MNRSCDFVCRSGFWVFLRLNISHNYLQHPVSSSQQYTYQTMDLTLYRIWQVWTQSWWQTFWTCLCECPYFALGGQNQEGFLYRLSSLSNLPFLALCRKVECNFQLFTMSACTYCWICYFSLSSAAFCVWFWSFILVLTIFCCDWYFSGFAFLCLWFSLFNNNSSSVDLDWTYLHRSFLYFQPNIMLGQWLIVVVSSHSCIYLEMQKMIYINNQIFYYTIWAKIIRNVLFCHKKKLVLKFCNMQLKNQSSSYNSETTVSNFC